MIKIDGFVIRSFMRTAKVEVRDIAKQCEVTSQFVSQVIHGVRRSPRIREAISTALGKPISELWPDDLAEHSQTEQEAA